jgi:hypothetical protein
MNDNGPIPPAAVRARVERLAAEQPDHGFIAVEASSPELHAALVLAGITGSPVEVTIAGHTVSVLPPEGRAEA